MTDDENTSKTIYLSADQAAGSIFIPADQGQTVTIPPPPTIEIRGDNGALLVAVHPEGRLEYGPGYEPDDAARRFWDGVEQTARTIQYGAPMNATINAHLKVGEEAERKVQRLDQMAAAWKERLPETVNRDTVVDAVHQVTRSGRESGGGDPRQAAYDAVFAYIRQQPRDFLPATVVDRNAMIWHAVHAALDAVGVPSKEGT
jgi:hypothetical protein